MSWSTLGLISYVALWILVLVQVVLTLALARLVGQLMNRRFPALGARVIDPGPPLGAKLENWQGHDLTGRPVDFLFPRPKGLFLFYLSPHCSACARMLPTVKHFLLEIEGEMDAAWIFVLGSRAAQESYVREHQLTARGAATIAVEDLPLDWRLDGAPFGVWVGAGGDVVAKGMTNNREHLESLRNAARVGHPSFQSYFSERERSALPTSTAEPKFAITEGGNRDSSHSLA